MTLNSENGYEQHLHPKMTSNKKLSQEEAAERSRASGYEMIGAYLGSNLKVLMRCPVHGLEKEVLLKNVERGGMMCCFSERQRERLSGKPGITLGAKLSDDHKAKIGDAHRGRKLTAEHIEKSRAARTGLKRSAEFSERQSSWLKEKISHIDGVIHRAATGKTAGKPGHFYMAMVGGLVKFGSTSRTMDYRISRLKTAEGDADLLMSAKVDDAGAYEAAMMNAHRSHWSHGEYFHQSVLAS